MQAPATELIEKDVIKVNRANGLPNRKLAIVLDPKARPIISGLSKDDVEGALKELGLLAFG